MAETIYSKRSGEQGSKAQAKGPYDCIVVGAGAAGMAASIYLSRYKLNHLVFGAVPGGQFLDATVVENYPGFISISGTDLVTAFKKHVESYGVKILPNRVEEVRREDGVFALKTDQGEEFKTRTLILALGAHHRRLDVPGEEKLVGRGISYCATCDAPFFKGKTVVVVGGGDSAVTAAIHLAAFAEKVYIIVRSDQYRAAPHELARMRSFPNVEEILNTTVNEIIGSEAVSGVKLSAPYKGNDTLEVQGVFAEIGLVPASTIVKSLGVELDEGGYIKVDPNMQSNVVGVFAAGDLAAVPGAIPFRQIVTSAADGARAATGVYQYLRRQTPSS